MLKLVWLVLPLFNEANVISSTLEALAPYAQGASILIIDDGSTDGSREILEAARAKYSNLFVHSLPANAGQTQALWSGLRYAHDHGAAAVITLDFDLQDDLMLIPQMLAKFESGCDVVAGYREDRVVDGWPIRIVSDMTYRSLKLLSPKIVHQHAEFRLMSRDAIAELLKLKYQGPLRVAALHVAKNPCALGYSRRRRQAGESKYGWMRLARLAGACAVAAVIYRATVVKKAKQLKERIGRG